MGDVDVVGFVEGGEGVLLQPGVGFELTCLLVSLASDWKVGGVAYCTAGTIVVCAMRSSISPWEKFEMPMAFVLPFFTRASMAFQVST